jgi:hypothetical protein
MKNDFSIYFVICIRNFKNESFLFGFLPKAIRINQSLLDNTLEKKLTMENNINKTEKNNNIEKSKRFKKWKRDQLFEYRLLIFSALSTTCLGLYFFSTNEYHISFWVIICLALTIFLIYKVATIKTNIESYLEFKKELAKDKNHQINDDNNNHNKDNFYGNIKFKYIILGSLIIGLIFGVVKEWGGDGDKINLKTRTTILTKMEISGIYKGSYQDNELNYKKAAKLELSQNGTFTANTYINGEELNEDGVSPQTGTFEIIFLKDDKKNEFGEKIGVEYTHALNLNAKTKWGIRTSKYVFTDDMVLLPVQSYIDTDLTLKRIDN